MRITPDETSDLPQPLLYKHFLSQKDLKVPKKAKSEATWKVLSDFVIQLRITTVQCGQNWTIRKKLDNMEKIGQYGHKIG